MVFLECFSGSEIRTGLTSTWLGSGSTLAPWEDVSALPTLLPLDRCLQPRAGSGTCERGWLSMAHAQTCACRLYDICISSVINTGKNK